MASALPGSELSSQARLDLKDALEEHRYRLGRWRIERMCRDNNCEGEDCLQAEYERQKAYQELIRVVWASTEGRGVNAGTIAEYLDVDRRTVQRWRADFRAGLAKHSNPTVE